MKNITMFPCVQRKWLALFAGACCLSISAVTFAEEGTKAGPKENRDGPCMADVAKLCKDVEKGEGRVAKCLKEHEDELSSACKNNMGKMKEKLHGMKEACEADAAKLCKDVEKGEGRVAKCLKEHEGELSSTCKDNMGRMKEKLHGMKEACEADAKKHCKDTKPGGGRIMQCLKKHEGELSSECKDQMGRKKGKM